jgi:hypothetical protein
MPSFMPGVATSSVQKLGKDTHHNNNEGSQHPDEDEETSILDIGALHAGQFFGEASFLFDAYKSMSSMCFLPLSEFFHYFMII